MPVPAHASADLVGQMLEIGLQPAVVERATDEALRIIHCVLRVGRCLVLCTLADQACAILLCKGDP